MNTSFQVQKARRLEMTEAELLDQFNRGLFDMMPDLVLLSTGDGEIKAVNSRIKSWLGYGKDEVVGMSALSVPFMTEKSKKKVTEVMKSRMKGEEPEPYDVEFITNEGERVWGRVNGTVLQFVDVEEPVDLVTVTDVTDYKRMVGKVTEQEAWLSKLFEASPEAIVVLDKAGKVLDVNDRLFDWLGYTSEEIRGKSIMQLPYLSRKSKLLAAKKLAARLLGKDVPAYELDFIHKDGSKRIGRIHARLIRDEEGHIMADLVMISEVTEEKLSQHNIEKHNEILKAMTLTAERFLSAVPERWEQNVLDVLAMLGEAQAVSRVYAVKSLPADSDEGFFLRYEWKRSGERNAFKPMEDELKPVTTVGWRDWVEKLKKGEVVEVVDPGEMNSYWNVAAGVQRIELVPVFVEKEWWGALGFEHTDKEGHYDTELDAQKTTALTFGAAIERKRLDEELYSMKLGFERAHDIIFITDEDARITYVNPAFTQLYGYTWKEVAGKDPRLLQSGMMPDEFYEWFWDRLNAKEQVVAEMVNKTKAGEMVALEASVNPVLDSEHRLMGYMAIQRDVTEQKRIERELERKANLEQVVSTISSRFVTMLHEDFDNAVEASLAELGKLFGADRAYLFLIDHENTTMTNSHEWVAENIEPMAERIQRVPMEEFHWIIGELRQGKIVYVPQLSSLPSEAQAERKEFEAQHIQSLVNAPVIYGERLEGFLGVDAVISRRRWSEVELKLLRTIGEVFVNAIHRVEAERELRKEKESVESKVEERTRKLKEKTQALQEAQRKITEGWMQLQAEKARLQASMQALPLGLMLINTEHDVLVANEALVELVDCQLEDGKVSFECVNTAFQQEGFEFWKVCPHCRGDTKMYEVNEVEYRGKHVRIFSVPVMQEEELIGAVVVLEDITEERELQKTRDEFFSVAAHELRTPLTAIRGNVSLLQQYYAEKFEDEEVREMLDDVHTSSKRLIQIVNDFLDASRLELNKLTMKPERFDVVVLVKKAMEDLEHEAEENNLGWHLDFSEEGVYFVQADPARIEQVMVNLLGNTLKYTPEGGVRVWIEGDEEQVRIKVTDTGVGIEEKDRQFLFQKFKQVGADGYTRNVSQSTGMGLYISKLLMEANNGNIYLEWSEKGRGSTFTIELPRG